MSNTSQVGAHAADAPRGAGAVHLIGISLPRSGHHFIENLLRNYLGEDRFGYCSEAGHNRCCGEIICPRVKDVDLFLRKSHDYDFSISKTLPNAFYLVQHREPAARVQSALELIARNDPRFDLNDKDGVQFWLAREAQYVIEFYRKWIENPPPNAIVVDYDALVAEPSRVAADLFGRLGWPFSREKFESDNGVLREYKAEARGVPDRQTMRARDVRASAVPIEMIADFDSLVRRHCSGAGWLPSILSPSGKQEVSHIYQKMQEEKKWADRQLWVTARREARRSNPHLAWHLIERLKARQMDQAAYRVCQLLAQRGVDLAASKLGELAYDASRRCAEVGELEQAVALAQQAVRHQPCDEHERYLKELLASRIELEDGVWATALEVRELAEGAAAARRFADAAKWYGLLHRTEKHEEALLGKVNLQLRLAEMLLNAGEVAEAELELSRVLKKAPREAEALFHRANALQHLGRRDDAIKDISRAVKLKPGVSAYLRRKGQLLLANGRAAEAIKALNAALAVDPQDAKASAILGGAKRAVAREGDKAKDRPAAAT
jgi:tetratricopeptide (TPR) repeat protein